MMKLTRALDELCDCEYPASIEDIETRCENVRIELQDGSETTLGEMLDLLDDPPDTFESSDDLYNTLMSLAPQGSVGRANYDDRGTTRTDRNQQSF
ncbi:MAG: hypothetical protein A07HR60_02382 [uncultured archaeon A07HR60]|jgi:hypothetical protein|nr:MAG: hypothetical protein A07HR60_02382 [uncultured archaeon A07HR60]